MRIPRTAVAAVSDRRIIGAVSPDKAIPARPTTAILVRLRLKASYCRLQTIQVYRLYQVFSKPSFATFAQILFHSKSAQGNPIDSLPLANLFHQIEPAAVR